MRCQRLLSIAVSAAMLLGGCVSISSAQTTRSRKTRPRAETTAAAPVALPPVAPSVQTQPVVQTQTLPSKSEQNNSRLMRAMRGRSGGKLMTAETRTAAKFATAQKSLQMAKAGDNELKTLNAISPKAAAAINDECTGAADIPNLPLPALSPTYDISNATVNASDPAISQGCLSDGSLTPTRSLWYTFTPASSGTYFVSTCADAPTNTTVTDTVMSIYTSSTGGCGGAFTQVPSNAANGTAGCDDDGCLNDAEATFQSVVKADLIGNTKYFVLVRELSASTTAQPIEAGKADLQVRVSRLAAGTRRPNPGDIIISEYRPSAKGNARDEYVELFNTTNDSIDIGGGDYLILTYDPRANTSAGTVPGQDGLFPVFISTGVVLPPRGYYLITNSATADRFGAAISSYSLENYTKGDNRITSEDQDYFLDNQGVAFVRETFNGTDPSNISSDITVLDSVGFQGDTNQATPPRFSFVEGTGLTPYSGVITSEFAFVRRLVGGFPQDTNNNANDFLLLSATAENIGTRTTILGSPGPQNQNAARLRNTLQSVSISLLDPSVGVFAQPNNFLDVNDFPLPGSQRSLKLRRRFTNSTGRPLTQLRIRILSLTTLNNRTASEADLRLVSSSDFTVTSADGTQTYAVKGLTLDVPPSSPTLGGGINSTASVATITLATPLPATAPGNTVNVEVKFAVQVRGDAGYVYAVEGAN